MRIWSTEQSVAKNEPTIMALAETLLAVAISVGIAIRYQTLTHVALGACIAPFLLMRSPESVALGVRWFNYVKPKQLSESANPFFVGWAYLRILVSSVVVKIAATVRHPVKGVQSIPANWVRVVLCTDLRTPVELVPGVGPAQKTLSEITTYRRGSSFSFLLLATIVTAGLVVATRYLSRSDSWFASWLEGLITPVATIFALGLACYVVAYLYRLSLKSTALVWLPLVYVVRATFDNTVKLSVQLDEIRRSALWKLIRILAWITLALLAWKILILPNAIELWNSQPWTRILNVYVMPDEIHPWHLATGLNAAITLFGFYYFLDRAPRRLREGIWNESPVLRGVQIFTFIRGTISIYTIFVGLLLTVRAAQSMNWPAWSGKLIPW
jgi:hypothetical protein